MTLIYDDEQTKNTFNRFDLNSSSLLDKEATFKALTQLNIQTSDFDNLITLIDDKYDGIVSERSFCQLVYICTTADLSDPYQILFYSADVQKQKILTKQQTKDLLIKLGYRIRQYTYEELIEQFISRNETKVDFNSFCQLINFLVNID